MEPKTLKKRRLLAGAGVTVAASAALMVSVALPSASSASTGARAAASSALVMESSQETTLTDNFNPFVSTSAANTVGATSLIYESMLQFDAAKPLTKPYDFLATGYTWGSGGKSITFAVRQGVKWSNGSPLTAADVAFTYNMLVKYPDTNTNGIPVTGASASGNNVTVTFSSPQYTNLQYIGSVYIVPQSIWGSLSGDPATFTDTNPIGSGPYELSSFQATAGVALSANANYWGGPWNAGGGAPAVSTVQFPLLADTNTVLGALENNSLDWAGNFIPGLFGGYTNQSPSTHHTWFAPVQTNTLEPNLRTWPMNQLAVRKAVSLAINRTAISKQGESGLEPVATNASGLVLPNFASLLAPAVKGATLSANANATAADGVLKAAGYALDKAGFYALKGKEVDITITDPANYSDYALDDQLMANELKAAHIKASFDGLSDNAWYADLADGKFGSATSHWSNTAILPYGVYDGWLNSALDTSNAGGDFEGLKNTAMDKDLAALAGQTTTAGQLKYLAPIEQYVAQNLPVIPTVYGAAFDEYSTVHFTGWPSAGNAYESGSPNTPTNEVVVLHLKPVS